jgi:hypothetical protein
LSETVISKVPPTGRVVLVRAPVTPVVDTDAIVEMVPFVPAKERVQPPVEAIA